MQFDDKYEDVKLGIANDENGKGVVLDLYPPRRWVQLGTIYVKHVGKRVSVSPLPRTGFTPVDIEPSGKTTIPTKGKAMLARVKAPMIIDAATGTYTIDIPA